MLSADRCIYMPVHTMIIQLVFYRILSMLVPTTYTDLRFEKLLLVYLIFL